MSKARYLYQGLVVVAAAALLAACTSVSLGPSYSPPPIKTPGPLSDESDLGQPLDLEGMGAQPSPVTNERVEPVDQFDPMNPDEYLVTLTAHMSPYNVVPPVPSAATGRIDVLYDRNTRLLRWKASWSDLSSAIVSVQFYGPAGVGETGPVTMIWPGPYGSRYEGRATLTAEQDIALVSGKWYVGVSTASYPHGELRGQLEAVR